MSDQNHNPDVENFALSTQKFAAAVTRLGTSINLLDSSLAATMQWAEGWLTRAETLVARLEKVGKV